MLSQFFRLNSSLVFLSFSSAFLSFSSQRASYYCFSQHFLSLKPTLSNRFSSLMAHSLTFCSICMSCVCLLSRSCLVLSISSLRSPTTSLSRLNSSKNRSNSSSSLYFLSNSPCRLSSSSLICSTFCSQCSFSFLSIMMRLRSSASTLAILSSEGRTSISSNCLEFLSIHFSRSSSFHWSHSYCASVQNFSISFPLSFSNFFLSFLCFTPISFKLLMISISDLSPRNCWSLWMRSQSASSPKMISLRVSSWGRMPSGSKRQGLISLREGSLGRVPQSSWAMMILWGLSSVDWMRYLSCLRACCLCLSLLYSPSFPFSSCSRSLESVCCSSWNLRLISSSLYILSSLVCFSAVSSPFSCCNSYLLIFSCSCLASLTSKAVLLRSIRLVQLSDSSLIYCRFTSIFRQLLAIHWSIVLRMPCFSLPLFTKVGFLSTSSAEACDCPCISLVSPCLMGLFLSELLRNWLLRSSSSLLRASLSINISSCGQT